MTPEYFPGQDCDCEARSSYECGCGADWTPTEVYKLRKELEEAKNAITGWENKWEFAVEMAARAENERDTLKAALEAISNLAKTLKNERDEAREALEFRRELYKVQEKCLEDARRERDEARESLKHITEHGHDC